MKIETVIDVLDTFLTQERGKGKESNPDFKEVMNSVEECWNKIHKWTT